MPKRNFGEITRQTEKTEKPRDSPQDASPRKQHVITREETSLDPSALRTDQAQLATIEMI